MARKPRSQRSRSTYSAPAGTQVLDHDDDASPAAPAAVRQRPRPVAHVAPAARVVDYSYVMHDVIRIAIITVVLIGGMIGISMVMR